MQEVFEKIIEELEENQTIVFRNGKPTQSIDFVKAIEIVERSATEYEQDREYRYMAQLTDAILKHGSDIAEKYEKAVSETSNTHNNGWVPVESGKLPENEKEVEITFRKNHYKTGETLYLTARAFYEDGTITTEDSAYGWSETDNWEYCEEKDACIIPEGWYEGVSFTEEFGIVDMPVIAWRYLTEPYQQKGE